MKAASRLSPPDFLGVIGHEVRWRLLAALARSDRRVQELVELVDEPANLVSYHLRRLKNLALVSDRRSAADGRDIYYHLDVERLRELYFETGETLHPALAAEAIAHREIARRAARPIRVLFLCTHNSARSQMAEGLLRNLGAERFEVASAGTAATRVHPLAIEEMKRRGIDITSHRSKVLDEFLGERFDYVITVCDNAGESCPVFPGSPERIHWSIADPAAFDGTPKEQQQAFHRAADELAARIRLLLALTKRR